MLALVEYERGLCDCGFHADLIGDERMHFAVENHQCEVCAAADQWSRVQGERDRAMRGESPPAAAPDPADGRKTTIHASEVDQQSGEGSP